MRDTARRIHSFFRKKNRDKVKSESHKNPEDVAEDGLTEFKIIVKKNLPSELLSEVLGLNENINEQGKKFNQQGKRDGSIGVRNMDQVRLKIRAIVSSIANPLKSSADGITRGIESLKKLKGEEQKKLDKEYNKRQEFLDWLDQEYVNNPRNFSRSMGIFYVIISLFLILADIPLALELTSKGLDLSIIPSTTSGIQYLFINFWTVIKNNWEVFILSTGIALCTVYIKIYYDEFLGRPLDKQALYFKTLSKNETFDQVDLDTIRSKDKRRSRIKLGVLFISFLTIICLGVFRYRTVWIEALQDPENTLRNQIYDPPGGLLVAVVFILLTLLFPLVGGICASLGINNIHNHGLHKKAKSELKTIKEQWDKFSKEIEEITVKYNIWKSYLFRFLSGSERTNWPNIEQLKGRREFSDTEMEIRDYLIACYIQGYNEGVLAPKSLIRESSLFDKAWELRNRKLSQESGDILRAKREITRQQIMLGTNGADVIEDE